jgi:superfamily II DNA or RNA helicase
MEGKEGEMNLRRYQREAVDAIRVEKISGGNRQLVVLPTASGKTVIFAQLPKALNLTYPEQMVVIAQSDDICVQAVKKLQASNPYLRVGMEKAEHRSTPMDDIIVASIQTLQGTTTEGSNVVWSPRLRNIDPQRTTTVVIDECHHFAASQYADPARYFGVYKPDAAYNDPAKLLVGVTATPNRTDGKGLGALFDKIVYSRDILSMIRDGWLAEPRAFRVETQIDLSQISVSKGDFVSKQLSKTVNTPERNALVVEKYKEYGEGFRALAFTVDIEHSDALAKAFNDAGIKAAAVSGKTKNPTAIYDAFEAGEIQVMCSCQKLLEGFDSPIATVALMCRPSKSELLYTQMVGRVLRPYPAPEQSAVWTGWRKPYAIIIDFVDVSARNSLIQIPSLFGLRSDFKIGGKKIVEVLDEIERLKTKQPGLDLSAYADLAGLQAVAERIDLFAAPRVPEALAGMSGFTWTTGMGDSYQLCLPDKGILRVSPNLLGHWDVSMSVNGVRKPIQECPDLKAAIKAADRQVPGDAKILLESGAKWRGLAPTEKQVPLLAKLYPEMRKPFASEGDFFRHVVKTYSRGDVTALIAEKMNKRR